jgi:putative hydrolase
LLALVEGWVDDVVDTAIADRLASNQALRETMRRRRATGGPAERAFGTLVGMHLRPTSLREAATIFQALRSMKGMDARDALWAHPDLLPDAEDLTEPMDFIARSE